MVLILLSVFYWGIFVYYVRERVKTPWRELSSGVKWIKKAIIEDRTDHRHYGFTMETALLMAGHRPNLKEYFILVNGVHYEVEQESYNRCTPGSEIEISLSPARKKLLRVEVVSNE